MKNTYKIGISTLLLTAPQGLAEENLWLYTTGTDTRPEGSWELKLSDISRLDKRSGDYAFHDIRPEIEYGITDRLTIGAEVFIFSHDYSDVDPIDETRDPVVGSFSDIQFGGFEIKAKYNVLSPYKDPFGLSFVAGWEHRDVYRLDGADIDQDAIILQALLQKNYLDNTLVFAFNAKAELERRRSGSGQDFVLEEEIAFDISAGVSYRVAPKWFIGMEIRYQSDFLAVQEFDENGNFGNERYDDGSRVQGSNFDLTNFSLGNQFQYGTYFGPTVHYAEEGWWATAGALYLIKSGGDGKRNGAVATTGKAYDEHERWHLGASVGFEF